MRLDGSSSPGKISVRGFRASGLDGPMIVPVGPSDEGWGRASGVARFVPMAGSETTVGVVAVAS